jgi:hypothetical protein
LALASAVLAAALVQHGAPLAAIGSGRQMFADHPTGKRLAANAKILFLFARRLKDSIRYSARLDGDLANLPR